MDTKHLLTLVFQVAIIGTVFGFGLKSTRGDLLYLWRRPGLLVRSVMSILVLMPALVVLLVEAFDLRLAVEVALVALAVSPVPPLLPQRESKASGRMPYGIALMLLMGLVSVFMIPLVLHLLELVFSRTFSADTSAIARIVLIAVVLPLLAGVAVRASLPLVAKRLERPVAIAASGLLVIGALVLLAGTWRAIWEAIGDGTIFALIAFVVVGLVIGHLMGGPEREHSVVLALSTACRHPAIALGVAALNFPEERFGGIILLYLLVNIVVGIPYLLWQRRVGSAAKPG